METGHRLKGVPKQRLDALTDGVFAFAMTLLVISLDLPSDAQVTNAGQLLGLLAQLQDTLLVYVISFVVLGARWIRNAKDHGSETWCSYGYAWAVIIHLFFVTLIPFSTKLVGLYGEFWPAVCLYAANTILTALSSMRAADLLAKEEQEPKPLDARLDLTVLIVTALLSCALAFLAPGYSMYAYLLNAGSPFLRRALHRPHHGS
ncbi:TMEM175 family protein [Aestuariivirga litoralis]|uniref:TMEM175 family protein n=1 Tax=Aestuariivirga litoralis TaxID=2650924 RepID=UPI0011B530E9|nr:TMEM175 family protein [Aestuariivirga litoralis]